MRMIVRLQLPVWRVDRPGLKLEAEQFGRRAARTFESRLLPGGLPARLSETQIQFRRFAFRLDHAKTRWGQGDQQRGAGSTRQNIKPLSRSANQPSDANLLVFELCVLVMFARRPGFAVDAST